VKKLQFPILKIYISLGHLDKKNWLIGVLNVNVLDVKFLKKKLEFGLALSVKKEILYLIIIQQYFNARNVVMNKNI